MPPGFTRLPRLCLPRRHLPLQLPLTPPASSPSSLSPRLTTPASRRLPSPLSRRATRSEEHTSDSSHSQISYAVFCLKKKKNTISRCLPSDAPDASDNATREHVWTITQATVVPTITRRQFIQHSTT